MQPLAPVWIHALAFCLVHPRISLYMDDAASWLGPCCDHLTSDAYAGSLVEEIRVLGVGDKEAGADELRPAHAAAASGSTSLEAAIDDVRTRAATTRQPAGAGVDRVPAADAGPGLFGPVAEELAEQGRRRCRCADHHRHHQRSPARCTQPQFQAEYTRPLSVPIKERSHGPGTSR